MLVEMLKNGSLSDDGWGPFEKEDEAVCTITHRRRNQTK